MTAFLPGELDTLAYWIRSREKVRVYREAGLPKPWTHDSLLLDYRWCNVRRMDDRVSRWLFASFYDVHASPCNALAQAVLGRLINWPDSLRLLLGTGEGRRFDRRMLSSVLALLGPVADRGDKVFTAAYIIPGREGQSKLESVVETTTEAMHGHLTILSESSAEATWYALQQVRGLGEFLAGQVVADIAGTDAGRSWRDAASWAPLGPGSRRGMNRLLGRGPEQTMPQLAFDDLLRALTAVLKPRIADIWTDRGLIAMDLQNCLCEFDKYRRLQLGQGTVRSRYPGRPDTTKGSIL